ncbi:hypothetical protein LZ554_004074 [Drepanopeziza brunnea f. sp. 'monogermtubi']|nr:hypothetical protein LZ554_004074 [Drepanopeziza brunnea f. sp. 'monogermtubi']
MSQEVLGNTAKLWEHGRAEWCTGHVSPGAFTAFPPIKQPSWSGRAPLGVRGLGEKRLGECSSAEKQLSSLTETSPTLTLKAKRNLHSYYLTAALASLSPKTHIIFRYT